MVVFPSLDETYGPALNGTVEADNSTHRKDNEIRTAGRSGHTYLSDSTNLDLLVA